MKKLMVVLTILVFAGCGSEPEQQEAPEVTTAASDQCEAGGLAVTVDGETYHICNGQDGAAGSSAEDGTAPTVETTRLAQGDDGNECPGEAMDVTITSEEGSDTHQVCLTYEPHIVLLSEIITAEYEAELTFAQAECECNWEAQEYADVDECVDDYMGESSYQQYMTWCIDQAYTVYDRPHPASVDDFLTCSGDQVEESLSCVDILDGGQSCEPTDFGEYNDCRSDLDSFQCQQDLEDDEEGFAWFMDYVNFLDLYCGGL